MIKKAILSTLVLAGLFAVNRYLISSKYLKNIYSIAAYPFLMIQKKALNPIFNWGLEYKTSKEYKSLIDYYKKENSKLQAKLIEFSSYGDYVRAVKEISDFSKRYKKTKSGILSQIILKNLDENNHFILIDAGSKMGVKQDMVLVCKNFLIGRVKEVYPFYSKAILITDKNCKIAAYCASNGLRGIHSGQNALKETKLNFVNNLKTVTQNDLVLSSGEGTVFPKGFGLGYVKSVKLEGFNYNITVKPLIDFASLDYCYVIQKGAELV